MGSNPGPRSPISILRVGLHRCWVIEVAGIYACSFEESGKKWNRRWDLRSPLRNWTITLDPVFAMLEAVPEDDPTTLAYARVTNSDHVFANRICLDLRVESQTHVCKESGLGWTVTCGGRIVHTFKDGGHSNSRKIVYTITPLEELPESHRELVWAMSLLWAHRDKYEVVD